MIKSALAVFGAIGYFFAGLTGQVDTSNSKAQVADPVAIEASTTPPVLTSTATSTGTTTPTTTTDPIITTATVDKQTFDKPSTVTVSWVGKNIVATTPISVSVVNASTNVQAIAPTNTAFSVGKKALTIPNTFKDGGYSILLKATINKKVLTLASVPFTVTSPAIPDAQISVIYPMKGYTFKGERNQPIEVKWDFKNIPATTPVTFVLVNSATGEEVPVTTTATVLSVKTKLVKITGDLKKQLYLDEAPPGLYKMKVSAHPLGKSSVHAYSEEFVLGYAPGATSYPRSDIMVLSSTSTEYTTGDTVKVGWTGNFNANPSDKITLTMWSNGYIAGNLSVPILLGSAPILNHSAEFKIPAGASTGEYDIKGRIAPMGSPYPHSVESIDKKSAIIKFNKNKGSTLPVKIVLTSPVASNILINTDFGTQYVNLAWTASNYGPSDKVDIYVAPKGYDPSTLENWLVIKNSPVAIMGRIGGSTPTLNNRLSMHNSSLRKLPIGTYNVILKPNFANVASTSVLVSGDIKVTK
ncbi:MAG: hypothetical protein KBC87_01075 [Candidatus Pacebacteria bacterium]|nr:hypothetical protein [Candidatus Paceibacterota bacterium]